VHGGLAQTVTRALRRRWPDAEISSTTAGTGRVQVVLPLALARALRLAGPGASTAEAGAELAGLLGRPVRVVEVHRLAAGDAHPVRYAVVIDLEGR
jgi:hypothetical protein